MNSKIDKPGRMIIKTPKNPINIAIQIFAVTFSFKNIIEKTTTIIGVDAPILWASARLRYLKARTNKPDSTIDNILLSICIFQL